MTGIPIKDYKKLKVGDYVIETREKYEGLVGRIVRKNDFGLYFEIVKKPNNSELYFEIGEEFYFYKNNVLEFFVKKVEKNNIKKL